MKHVKTKYIAVIDLRKTFNNIAEVDVTKSYDANSVKNCNTLVCYYKPASDVLCTQATGYLYYNEQNFSKDTLFAVGYYPVKEIREVQIYEEEKTIYTAQ